MPVPLIAGLWAAFAAIAVPLAIRIVAAIGIGVASYAGVKHLLDSTLELVQGYIGGLGADILVYVAVFRIDQFMTIVFSAMLTKATFAGMSAAGVLTKMQWRPTAGGA